MFCRVHPLSSPDAPASDVTKEPFQRKAPGRGQIERCVDENEYVRQSFHIWKALLTEHVRIMFDAHLGNDED